MLALGSWSLELQEQEISMNRIYMGILPGSHKSENIEVGNSSPLFLLKFCKFVLSP